MSHYEDAKKGLDFIERSELGLEFSAQTGQYKANQIALAQLKATLALVDQARDLAAAQERANQQARIANLIALATREGHRHLSAPAWNALSAQVPSRGIVDFELGLDPQIAAALGIEVPDT